MAHPLVAHIEAMNAAKPNMLPIVSELAHWQEVGIETPEQFARAMAIDTYSECYKEAHGIRPSWINFDALTTAQIEEMINDI